MSFIINSLGHEIPTLTTELIGHFSIDSNSQYRADLSQLRYYIFPLNSESNYWDYRTVGLDLKENFPDTNYKSIPCSKWENILRWISDNFNQLERPLSIQKECWLNVDFICHREALKRILCSLYITDDEWIIYANKYRGTIYLCEFYTNKKKRQCVNKTMTEKQITSERYKFEQHIAGPSYKSEPLVFHNAKNNERNKFYCMFKTKFDNYSLLYGADIHSISSKELITDTLIGKSFELIELKILPMDKLNSDTHEIISSEKILMWWSQNYLMNIDKTICGIKDRNTVVRRIKEYSTHELPYLSKPSCNVDECKIFCKIFLNNVKKIVTKDYTECMYKFHWKPSAKYAVNYSEEAPDNETYFLKQWFFDKAEKYRNHSQ
ncbi:hypothetical protein P5V15_003205 [Pogonomyrmex californicus]